MSLTNTQHAAVMRIYDELRNNNRHIQNERYEEVVRLCPEISDIDNRIIDISMSTALKRINTDSSDTNSDELSSELDELLNRKKDILLSIGKPKDYLDDIFTCPICKDTGYVSGRKCSCFNKKAVDLIYKDSNIKNITEDENFSTFSYKWYDNTNIDSATGLTPYNNMHKVHDVCMEFARNFDHEFSNLLLFGETGVGKTFLTNCIAKELLDSCHSVIYLTAIEMFDSFQNRDFNKYSSEEDYAALQYYLDCDLLIIDDLGTETVNSYTNSKLFYIINERLLRRKSVIISTNYDISQIEDCYSERIFSRIVSSYKILRLFGEDIRYLKRTHQYDN